MMIQMALARFSPSPLSKPWGWVIGMIDRLNRMGQIASVPNVGNIRIGEMGEGMQELVGEDFWARE